MSVHQTDNERHLQMIYRNNVVVSMDGKRIIVVHSKRSLKPLLPFEISKEVYEQWKKRDNRIAVTDTPYKDLFTVPVTGSSKLEYVAEFNDIEFSEE